MQNRIVFYLAVPMLLVTVALFAKAESNGTGTRGGGEVVVTLNGELHLLDLVDAKDIDGVRSQRLRKNLPSTCSGAKSELLRDTIKSDAYVELRSMLESVAQTSPMLAQVLESYSQLIFTKVVLIPALPQPIPSLWTDSERIPKELQTPVALLNEGLIYIVKPLFNRLSARDQAALVLHETLRNIYFVVNTIPAYADQARGKRLNYRSRDILTGIEKFVRAASEGRDLSEALSLLPILRDLVQINFALESLDAFSKEYAGQGAIYYPNLLRSDLEPNGPRLLRAVEKLNAAVYRSHESRTAADMIAQFVRGNRAFDHSKAILTALSVYSDAPQTILDLRRDLTFPHSPLLRNDLSRGSDHDLLSRGIVDAGIYSDCWKILEILRTNP